MELMLPLQAKAEARPKEGLAISQAEISEYVGTYANKPERVELLAKQGRLILKREDGEFPITKIADYPFSISSGESEAEEFALVPDAEGRLSTYTLGGMR